MPRLFNILTLLLILFTNLITFGQSFFETDIKEAFRKSKKENRNLIIFRCDSTSINNYKKKKKSFPVTYYSLDSLFNSNDLRTKILEEYFILKLEKNNEKPSEIEFSNKFFNENNPNFIIFSPDSSLLTYLKADYYSTGYINDILSKFKDGIIENSEKAFQLKILEASRKNNLLSDIELLELIRLRTIFNLKSREHLNELALKKGKLTGDFQYLVTNQDLKTNDPFVVYILNYQKENNSFWEQTKLGLINDILKNARLNSDKIEFESSLQLQENYYKNFIQKHQDLINLKYTEHAISDLKESQFHERMDFYLGIADTLNIIKNGLIYADSLTTNYQKKRDYYLKVKMPIANFYNESDSEFNDRLENKQKYNEELIRTKSREYDEFNADLLNTISWNFYIYSTDTSNLTKALSWSEFSLKLNSTPEKIDTYAHLLFALGQTYKAINTQIKAIKAAEKDEMYKELIENMKLELKRFQNK